MVQIGTSTLDVFPLNLGGNVFGWTADVPQSFAVLDAYAAAGGNFIDTADSYSHWVPGNVGGESELIIGRWMAERGNRDQMVIATKVGKHPQARGLSSRNINQQVEASLKRLQTDYIDLYYAHADDHDTPLEETMGAFDELVRAGKVRYLGASNYSAERLEQALKVSDAEGLARYVALQPEYNLVERAYENDLASVVAREQLSCVPYYALASGFLTGKYRRGQIDKSSPRSGAASAYLDDEGERVLAALDQVAESHGCSVTTVALAWLAAQPTVAAPIASARTPEQVADLVAVDTVLLSAQELQLLDDASQVNQ